MQNNILSVYDAIASVTIGEIEGSVMLLSLQISKILYERFNASNTLVNYLRLLCLKPFNEVENISAGQLGINLITHYFHEDNILISNFWR